MTMVLKIRFASSFLGLLLVVNCIGDPLAEARRGPTLNAEVAAPVQKVTAGSLTAVGAAKTGTAGRTAMVYRSPNGGSSEISSGTQPDSSNIKKSSKDEALESVHPPSIGTALTNIDNESSSSSFSGSERRLENLEAAEEEIVNLFRRDYSRGPPKAKRKPPINNKEPSN